MFRVKREARVLKIKTLKFVYLNAHLLCVDLLHCLAISVWIQVSKVSQATLAVAIVACMCN